MRFQSLPSGHRSEKFKALANLGLEGSAWVECPTDWRAPFLPAAKGAWALYPRLEELFVYNGSGVMPGRTWVIAPDVESLEKRWRKLLSASPDQMDTLFHPHLVKGKLGDRYSKRVVKDGLPGYDFPQSRSQKKKAHRYLRCATRSARSTVNGLSRITG